MKFNWANTLLLVLIMVELLTGVVGLMSGAPEKAAYVQTHRVAGYGILVILIWKAQNALFSLRRRRRAAPRSATIALTIILAATLALGFAWSFAGPFTFGLFSGLSWHIYAGAALLPLLLWHSIYHTRGLTTGASADRRSFLQLAGVAIMGLFLWQAGELGARVYALPGATRRFTGSYVKAGEFPVVSWLNDRPAPVDASTWRLTIRGAVERETVLRHEDLDAQAELEATIDCTGGWYSSQVWRGIPVAELLDMAGPTAQAASVTVTSVTGYYRRFTLKEARRYLLATHVAGEELTHGHGSPVRLVAPGKRGFEWVKWVKAIEVNENPKWLQPPLPIQ